MSNYTIATNFLSKDSLTSGNPLKAVKGADLTTEFNAIQVAVNTKIDGVVQFAPDGNAAQPSFGFTSNAGTGMYNNAGVLGFATGNTLRQSINAAGAVVFSTPSAGTTLTVNGLNANVGGLVAAFANTSAASAYVTVTDGTVTSFVQASTSSGAGVLGTTSNHDVQVTANSAAVAVFGKAGGLIVGSPTGGNLGAGIVNATGLAINGNALAANVAKFKATTTSRLSNTTLTADPDLAAALGVGTWAISLYVQPQNVAGTTGFRYTLSNSGTMTGAFGAVGSVAGATVPPPQGQTTSLGAAVSFANTTTTSTDFLVISATITVTVAGTLSFSWSQNTSVASNTSVLAGSWMQCVKVG